MATLAADGLIARESGEWASDKLFYVARYMDIFTGSMKNKWAHRAYIDLMSGPGLCVVPSTGREFDGSPLLALKTKTPFTDVLLVEADPIWQTRWQNAHLVLICGHRPRSFLATVTIKPLSTTFAIESRTTRVSLTFVDLLGMNVVMATLTQLTSNLPMDLIITFPEMDVRRNWQAAIAGDLEHSDRFDKFFGTKRWQTAVSQLAGRRESDALIDFYAQQLKSLNYHTSVLPLTMKNTKGGTLYRPIFASRHSRGIEFWTEISSKRDPSGQQRLI